MTSLSGSALSGAAMTGWADAGLRSMFAGVLGAAEPAAPSELDGRSTCSTSRCGPGELKARYSTNWQNGTKMISVLPGTGGIAFHLPKTCFILPGCPLVIFLMKVPNPGRKNVPLVSSSFKNVAEIAVNTEMVCV